MKLGTKIGAALAGVALAVTGVVGVAPANALSGRLDNYTGRTIQMKSGTVYENVANGDYGYQVTSFRVPTYTCVRVTYRDGYWRNYTAGGSYLWITTRNLDGYLSRC